MILKDPIIDPGAHFPTRAVRYLRTRGYVLSDTSGIALQSECAPAEFGLLSVSPQNEFGDRRMFLGVVRIEDGECFTTSNALSIDVYGKVHHYLMTELSQELSVHFETLVTCRLTQSDVQFEQC